MALSAPIARRAGTPGGGGLHPSLWFVPERAPALHCCILDGVFAPALAADGAVGVVFHAASGLDTPALATVQALVRRRVLRACVRRGLLVELG